MATLARASRLRSAEELTARRELAAAFRLAAHFGWDDHVATHMSARLPDGSFLLNPFGLMFEEVTASSLMRMDLDGNVLEIPEGLMLNPAAFGVHGAVHCKTQQLRNILAPVFQWQRFALQFLVNQFFAAFGGKRQHTRQQLVGHHTHRINIRLHGRA